MGRGRADAAETRRLGLGPSLLYASAHFGVSILAFTVIEWSGHFYTGDPALGLPRRVDPALFAAALLFGRLFDAATDPLIGHWSDVARTRWGRRKPFVAAGVPLVVIGFALLWWTPSPEVGTLNFVYVLAMLAVFFLGFTLVSCPYLALLPEIARGERERVGLASLQALFNVLGNIAGALAGGFLVPRLGSLGMGLVVGAAAAVSFALGLLGPRERQTTSSAPSLRLRAALACAFRNRHFRHFGLAFLCFWVGLSLLLANVPFLSTKLLGGTAEQAGLMTGVALIASVACLPLVARAAARWGKRRLFGASLVWFSLLVPLTTVLGLPWIPFAGLVQGVVLFALAGPAIASLFVMPYALLADIADEDERVTGLRREAIYFGMNGFLYKVGLGVGGACAPLLWKLSAAAGVEAAGVRWSGALAALFTLGGAFVFRGYGLRDGASEASVREAA